MSDNSVLVERRTLLKGAFMASGVVCATPGFAQNAAPPAASTHLEDVALSPNASGRLSNGGGTGQC